MMSDTSLEQSLLIQEVSRRVVTLEDAITKINSTQNQLKQRYLEVKLEIKTTVMGQLEALRHRENYLLRQVDLLQQTKDAALQGEEDKLHQAVSSLNTALQMAETGHCPNSLADALEKVKNLNVNPEEMPTLSFTANLSQTSDAINNLGHIDTRALPYDRLFKTKASSVSLPRAFEDYEDDKHDVMHKNLSKPSTATKRNDISMITPRMLERSVDWLSLPKENMDFAANMTTNPNKVQFPPFASASLHQYLGRNDGVIRSVSSATSIRQWLCDTQGQANDEEEESDFEVISRPDYFVPGSAKGSSIEVLSMDENPPIFIGGEMDMALPSLTNPTIARSMTQGLTCHAQIPTLPYFHQIMSGPTTNWLLVDRSQDTQESSSTYCQEILNYFHDVPSDTKHWLKQYSDKKQKEECRKTCSRCVCPAKPDTVDIENMAQLTCIQDVPSDSQQWLFGRKDEDVDVNEADILPEVKAVCKANEPCLSFSECVYDKNCCGMLNEKSYSADFDNVFEQSVAKTSVEYDDMMAYFDDIARQSTDTWLSYKNDDEVDDSLDDDNTFNEAMVVSTRSTIQNPEYNNYCTFPPFSNFRGQDTTWLSYDETQSKPSASLCNFDNYAEVSQTTEWLVTASDSKIEAMEERWKMLFSHKIPSSPTHKSTEPGYFDNNVLTLDQQRFSEWLYPFKSYISNIPPSKSDWLFNGSNNDYSKAFSESMTKESWLAKSEFSLNFELKNSKELIKEDKSDELPESFAKGNGDKLTNLASVFDCFKKEHDNRHWVGND